MTVFTRSSLYRYSSGVIDEGFFARIGSSNIYSLIYYSPSIKIFPSGALFSLLSSNMSAIIMLRLFTKLS
jgi:hypothetical protein